MVVIAFTANGCYYQFCPRQESRLTLTEEKIQRSLEERERESERELENYESNVYKKGI